MSAVCMAVIDVTMVINFTLQSQWHSQVSRWTIKTYIYFLNLLQKAADRVTKPVAPIRSFSWNLRQKSLRASWLVQIFFCIYLLVLTYFSRLTVGQHQIFLRTKMPLFDRRSPQANCGAAVGGNRRMCFTFSCLHITHTHTDTHYTQYLLLTVARHTNTACPNSSFLYYLNTPPPTCQGFDAWALEQACWAVLVVPVIGVPAVVDAIVELLLDIHMFKLRCHRRHLDPPPLLSPDSWAIEWPLRKSTKPAVRGKKKTRNVCLHHVQ